LGTLAQDEGVRVLVLRAGGKAFCAGVDVADHTADKVGEMIPLFDRVCCALADFPVPVLAVLHGHALGGGCELVLCSDLAVAVPGAKIGQPEIQLAAVAPIAALRLPRLAGLRAAADLLLGGEPISAETALRLGLLTAVVPAEELEAWVERKVARLAGMSRVALVMTERVLALSGEWSAALPAIERLYLSELMASADAQEGLEAFLEKRAPAWKHR
jgi:cyclohexa-1,5-dienecarbonyl-CoA hydratase